MARLAFVVVCTLLAGLARAQKPPPPPPSTGEELAPPKVVVPEELAAATARTIIARGDCTGAVAAMSSSLSVGQAILSKDERIAGSAILARCALANKSWTSVIQAQAYLLDVAPDRASADDLIRAYLRLGEDKVALEVLKLIARKIPSQKANVAVAATLIDCHTRNFALCFTSSAKMLDLLAKTSSPDPSAVFETLLFNAASAGALGKYDVYDKQLALLQKMAGKNSDALEPVTTRVEEARTAKLFVDDDHAKELALGTYHLLASKKLKTSPDSTDALVTLRFINQDETQKSVKVSVEIPGVTDRTVETVPLPPGQQVTRLFTPPLKMDFDIAKLRAARTSQIAVRVTDQGTRTPIVDKALPITILPRDSLPLRRYLGSGNEDVRTTFHYAAAWITPNAPEVDLFLKKAKARLEASKLAFSGMQQATRPQVKAIFDELKAMGVSYVMDPSIFDERGQVQRTRLPADVLASTNAQCLEGAILYATLFEAIGLQPVLVFKKGHALIAWKPSKHDRTRQPLLFLETTLTGGPATFEQAMESGTRTFLKAAAEKQFDLRIGALLDVAKLRREGYSPQPF